MNCRLCRAPQTRALCADVHRDYRYCEACGLVFVPPEQYVSVEEEKKRYDRHDNAADHDGYRKFLSEVAVVAARENGPHGRILDFGCGKNAVLTAMLREQGFDCVPYDPLYGIGAGALSGRYAQVIACEVVEHLRGLREELLAIGKALLPGGAAVLRTRCYPSLEAFRSWWYKDDCTHINFFRRETVGVVAALLDCKEAAFVKDDLSVLRRKRW
ncbi:MAG: class I SAM-dependent methyltransferase [Chitinispirillaceae bacterium]|nr:class I SAM-dependent methyltransferase [Chitinispirillaceae bacterium]